MIHLLGIICLLMTAAAIGAAVECRNFAGTWISYRRKRHMFMAAAWFSGYLLAVVFSNV